MFNMDFVSIAEGSKELKLYFLAVLAGMQNSTSTTYSYSKHAKKLEAEIFSFLYKNQQILPKTGCS